MWFVRHQVPQIGVQAYALGQANQTGAGHIPDAYDTRIGTNPVMTILSNNGQYVVYGAVKRHVNGTLISTMTSYDLT